jgi:hypothetical protein
LILYIQPKEKRADLLDVSNGLIRIKTLGAINGGGDGSVAKQLGKKDVTPDDETFALFDFWK